MSLKELAAIVPAAYRPTLRLLTALGAMIVLSLAMLAAAEARIAEGARREWAPAAQAAAAEHRTYERELSEHRVALANQAQSQQDLRELLIEIRADVRVIRAEAGVRE